MTTLGTSVLYGKTLIFSLDKLAYKTSVLLFTFHSNNFFIFTFIRQKMRDFLSHSLFVFICCTLSIVQAIYYAPVVRVRNGRVRGELETVPYSTPVFAYKGIPYGKLFYFKNILFLIDAVQNNLFYSTSQTLWKSRLAKVLGRRPKRNPFPRRLSPTGLRAHLSNSIWTSGQLDDDLNERRLSFSVSLPTKAQLCARRHARRYDHSHEESDGLLCRKWTSKYDLL